MSDLAGVKSLHAESILSELISDTVVHPEDGSYETCIAQKKDSGMRLSAMKDLMFTKANRFEYVAAMSTSKNLNNWVVQTSSGENLTKVKLLESEGKLDFNNSSVTLAILEKVEMLKSVAAACLGRPESYGKRVGTSESRNTNIENNLLMANLLGRIILAAPPNTFRQKDQRKFIQLIDRALAKK